MALSAPARVDALTRVFNLDTDTLRALNPALRTAVWNLRQPVPRGYHLRVPEALQSWTSALLATRLAGTAAPPLLAAAAAPKIPSRPKRT